MKLKAESLVSLEFLLGGVSSTLGLWLFTCVQLSGVKVSTLG